MKCIDFDRRFAAYLESWTNENRDKYANMNEVEAQVPEVYMEWLNTPADWLGGTAPGDYFKPLSDPEALVKWMLDYHRSHINVPDMLFERIVDVGEKCVEPLMNLAEDADKPDEARVAALNLLVEIGAPQVMGRVIALMCARKQKPDLMEAASELLKGMGEDVVEPLIKRADGLTGEALESCLDILCNFPGDKRIYELLIRAFRQDGERRALYASFLGKLGDEDAVEPLKAALELSELNYLDYIEIVHAVEALGGEVEKQREFSGDEYYESLKHMQ